MAIQKRKLDWTAIKNALRLGGIELHAETPRYPKMLHSHRHYLCNRGYNRDYGSLDNWSVYVTDSETQDTDRLIGLILAYSKGGR